MTKWKMISLTAIAVMVRCAFAAEVAAETAPQAKPDARYLALLGVLHSDSTTLAKNIAIIKKGLASGPYGTKWKGGNQETGHGKITQEDLETFSRNLAEVLQCKNAANAAGALKDIEAFADEARRMAGKAEKASVKPRR